MFTKNLLVGLGRLELPTSPLSGVRSNHLSYRPYRISGLLLPDFNLPVFQNWIVNLMGGEDCPLERR